MKTIKPFLKAMCFIFLLHYVDVIYSQSPCPTTYNIDFTITHDSITCEYIFTPDTSGTQKYICSISWEVYSYGYYGVACDPDSIEANPLTYKFCWSGYYNVKMKIHFCDSTQCAVTKTIQVGCIGADVCDPDPERVSSISDPKVEITYIEPDTCDLNRGTPLTGCMSYTNGAGGYYVSCGWKWAIRVPPTNCNGFTYYVQYDSIRACGFYSCVRRYLDTNIICIRAYIDRTIYIVATSNHCCLPSGYSRGYYWTPTPAGGLYNIIDDPDPVVSVYCSAYRRCTDYTYCTENPVTLTQTSGWPATCFTGGQTLEQREYLRNNEKLNKLQPVIIYNIHGNEVYNGIWKFGDESNFYLNWPNGLQSGMYFVKFDGKCVLKLMKLN